MSTTHSEKIDLERVKELQAMCRRSIADMQLQLPVSTTLGLALLTSDALLAVQYLGSSSNLAAAVTDMVRTKCNGVRKMEEENPEALQPTWEKARGTKDPEGFLRECFGDALVLEEGRLPRIDQETLARHWPVAAGR